LKNLLLLIFYLTLLIILLLSSCTCEKPKLKTDLSEQDWLFHEKGNDKPLLASVPGCIHTDLLAHNEIPDPFYRNNEKELQWIGEKDWVYSTQFRIPDEMLAMDNIELKFKGLDTYADVFLNDSLILKADNFFREWNLNAKQLLKKENNKIKIIFSSAAKISREKKKQSDIPLKDIYPFTRKPAYHFGWDWGPVFVTAGIWKPVEIVAWNNGRILDLRIVQKILSDEKAELIFTFQS